MLCTWCSWHLSLLVDRGTQRQFSVKYLLGEAKIARKIFYTLRRAKNVIALLRMYSRYPTVLWITWKVFSMRLGENCRWVPLSSSVLWKYHYSLTHTFIDAIILIYSRRFKSSCWQKAKVRKWMNVCQKVLCFVISYVYGLNPLLSRYRCWIYLYSWYIYMYLTKTITLRLLTSLFSDSVSKRILSG